MVRLRHLYPDGWKEGEGERGKGVFIGGMGRSVERGPEGGWTIQFEAFVGFDTLMVSISHGFSIETVQYSYPYLNLFTSCASLKSLFSSIPPPHVQVRPPART